MKPVTDGFGGYRYTFLWWQMTSDFTWSNKRVSTRRSLNLMVTEVHLYDPLSIRRVRRSFCIYRATHISMVIFGTQHAWRFSASTNWGLAFLVLSFVLYALIILFNTQMSPGKFSNGSSIVSQLQSVTGKK